MIKKSFIENNREKNIMIKNIFGKKHNQNKRNFLMINVQLNFWLKANANISSSLYLSYHFTQRCAGYEHTKQFAENRVPNFNLPWCVPFWCPMSKVETPGVNFIKL